MWPEAQEELLPGLSTVLLEGPPERLPSAPSARWPEHRRPPGPSDLLIVLIVDLTKIGGSNDAVFGVVAAFLADDGSRVVAEVEKVEP